MTIRLTTLGNPSLLLGGEALTSLPGKPVTFGLLVFLAVEREATRDRLVSVFWPESSQEKARHALSQTLYELRQLLGEDAVESAGNACRITDTLWVDCLEFAEMAEAARHAEAVELYHGPFLEGVHLARTHPFEEWVERHRARFSRRYRAAADPFIRECRAIGDLERALNNAWKWVGLDPLDDGGQQHLIQLLAESGGRSEALAQYDRYKALLQSELGLDPLEETVELVKGIQEGKVGQASSGDVGPVVGETEPDGSGVAPATWKEAALTHGGRLQTGPLAPSAGKGAGVGLQELMASELSPSLEILRPIGKGNMAEVFLAREPHLKRLVAVKVLSPHLYSDPRARIRFEREAQAAARLNHPHVCTVHWVGTLSDGTPFLVTPFVKGTSLAQHLKAEGRLGPDEVRTVLREIASALSAAHKLNIIHRDIRPANVLRADETGRHSLCDFGISGVLDTGENPGSKVTVTGEILGHPAFISPEQMDGKHLTDRADIYSLGVLGYELLTGRTPPAAEHSPKDSGGTGVNLEPLTDYMRTTDPVLVDLIRRCLALEPTHRPSAADVEKKLTETSAPTAVAPNFVPAPANTFLSLLMEKRFLQIIGGYVAGGFLFLEAVDQLESRGYLAAPAYPLALATAISGFVAANILAWYHGQKGKQEMVPQEKWMLGMVAVGWVAAVVWVWVGG